MHSVPPAERNPRLWRRAAAGNQRLAALLALFVTLPAWAEESQEAVPELDWAPLDRLSEAQRSRAGQACCGAYVEPVREGPEAKMEPEEAPIRSEAERVESQKDGQTVLEGDVQVTQGYRSLSAECARFDRLDNEAEVSGDVTLREPGVLLRADRGWMDLDTGDAQMDDARFVLHEAHYRGEAGSLKKKGEDVLTLTDSQLTTCEPGSSDWSLKGADITLYPDRNYGTAKHARLKFFGVPLLYTPYLRFSLGERQTGFLFPSFSDSTRNGTEFSLPFYWNIAPNYDLTITPNYMSKRGLLWRAQARQLSRHFETQVDGGWIASDEGGFNRRQENRIDRGEITEEEAYPYRGEDRWLFHFQQTGGKNQRWSTEIDYTDLSDDDYLRDLDSGSLNVNRTALVTKTAAADYQGVNWFFSARAEELRSLSSARWPHRELPRLNANGHYRWGKWELRLDNEYARFDANPNFDGTERQRENIIVGQRARTDYGLTWNQRWPWGFVRPSAMIKTLQYDLKTHNLTEGADSQPSFAAPQAALDTGLNFERYGRWFGESYLQTFEPRLFYFYSDYEDQSELYDLGARPVNFDTKTLTFSYDQLFRTSRFSGGDRIDDANQVSVGLTSRFIDPRTGVEHASFSLGQIYYFEDRRVGLRELTSADDEPFPEHERSRSDLALQLSGRMSNQVRLTANATYDDYQSRWSRGSLSLRYLDDEYRIAALSYRYNRRPPAPGRLNPDEMLDRSRNQVDAALHWPLFGQWSLIGRQQYDITYEQELDTFVGIEYDDCCYRVRLLARRWLDVDYTSSPTFLETVGPEDMEEGIVFDIQFKGLGSIDERVGELLEKAIPGYDRRESAYFDD